MPRLQAVITDEVHARLVEIARGLGLKPNAAVSVIIMQHGKAPPVAARPAAPQQLTTKPAELEKTPGTPKWRKRRVAVLMKLGVSKKDAEYMVDNPEAVRASPDDLPEPVPSLKEATE